MSLPEQPDRERALRGILESEAGQQLIEWMARRVVARARRLTDSPDPAPSSAVPASKRRHSRPSPSRLAKWEAQWQAEQSAEADVVEDDLRGDAPR